MRFKIEVIEGRVKTGSIMIDATSFEHVLLNDDFEELMDEYGIDTEDLDFDVDSVARINGYVIIISENDEEDEIDVDGYISEYTDWD